MGIQLKDIEVINGPKGKPELVLLTGRRYHGAKVYSGKSN